MRRSGSRRTSARVPPKPSGLLAAARDRRSGSVHRRVLVPRARLFHTSCANTKGDRHVSIHGCNGCNRASRDDARRHARGRRLPQRTTGAPHGAIRGRRSHPRGDGGKRALYRGPRRARSRPTAPRARGTAGAVRRARPRRGAWRVPAPGRRPRCRSRLREPSRRCPRPGAGGPASRGAGGSRCLVHPHPCPVGADRLGDGGVEREGLVAGCPSPCSPGVPAMTGAAVHTQGGGPPRSETRAFRRGRPVAGLRRGGRTRGRRLGGARAPASGRGGCSSSRAGSMSRCPRAVVAVGR